MDSSVGLTDSFRGTDTRRTTTAPRGGSGRGCVAQGSVTAKLRLQGLFLNWIEKVEPVPLVAKWPVLMRRSPPLNVLNSVGLSNPR